jgi:hypothetical protein
VKLWKVQKFAGDVVYDLRNRNLLLPVLALIVALVAVPVLISRGGSDGGAGVFGFGTTSATSPPETENAVVAYHPGVRNYKKRLNQLSAKNPFTQQFALKPASDSAGTSDTSSGGGSQNVTLNGSVPGTTGVGGGSTGGGTGGSGKSPGKVKETNKTTYYWWQADVQVGESGTQLATMNNVKPFQFLPDTSRPVLTYLGKVGGTQAIFLVSKDVASIGGDGTCFPSVDSCQLLGLNAGTGADLIYKPDGKTYHVQVLRVRRVTSPNPPSF